MIDFLPWQIYNYAMAESEVNSLSPKTGRPPKIGLKKDVSLQLRISKTTAETLRRCAESMKVSRTEVIEEGIRLVDEKLGGQ